MANVSHFYDEQTKRYLLQIMRAFSNFQIKTGTQRDGNEALIRVPVRYGGGSREANNIINGNSANKFPTVPSIAIYITSMEFDRDGIREPNMIETKNIRQRKIDLDTNTITQEQGNAFSVERHMPVPYIMGVDVDIWTSNTDQKMQLFEQIVPYFNPSWEIQSTDNYLDWTSLTRMELERTEWSSRSIPYGTDDDIDIMKLSFSVPIWISLPARIKKMGVIHKIIQSIYDEEGELSNEISDDALLLGTRVYTTPMNYGVFLTGNELKLLGPYEAINPSDNEFASQTKTETDKSWKALVDQYGELTNGISQIRLEQPNGSTIVGSIAFHPSDPFTMLFTVDPDTVPTNTVSSVLKVIDPLSSGPGAGLASVAQGQRYLILNDIGSNENGQGSDAWRGVNNADLVASANDIIEYDGQQWNVVFDSDEIDTVEYVTTLSSGRQYKWENGNWVKSYEGEYLNGDWALVL